MLSRQLHTHHHNFFVSDEASSLGFIRISKNGSTSFCKNLNLYTLHPFTEANRFKIILCCLRDPVDRFLSSIPESIQRITTQPIQTPIDLDVQVPPPVLQRLLTLDFSTAKTSIHSICDCISEFGFFDSHHEPQVHFILDSRNRPLVECELFTLDRMNEVIKEYQTNNIEHHNSRLLKRRSPVHVKPTVKSVAKNQLTKLGVYKKDHKFNCFPSDSLQRHFIQSYHLSTGERFLKSHAMLLKEKLFKLRRELNEYKNHRTVTSFVEEHYKEDIKLFSALQKLEASKTPSPKQITLTSLVKEL